MEKKRLSYARAPGYAKSLCCTKSRVILRKLHFMNSLSNLPIKCSNQIRT